MHVCVIFDKSMCLARQLPKRTLHHLPSQFPNFLAMTVAADVICMVVRAVDKAHQYAQNATGGGTNVDFADACTPAHRLHMARGLCSKFEYAT